MQIPITYQVLLFRWSGKLLCVRIWAIYILSIYSAVPTNLYVRFRHNTHKLSNLGIRDELRSAAIDELLVLKTIRNICLRK